MKSRHKMVAQKNGLWAEFRLTTWGAVLTFASVFLPIRMIAPGAMMIGGSLQKQDDIVKISLAGPITNMIYASSFLGLVFTLPIPIEWSWILLFAAYINSFMAIFNLSTIWRFRWLQNFQFQQETLGCSVYSQRHSCSAYLLDDFRLKKEGSYCPLSKSK